ncbi:MAG TPA: ester cyclase [Gaiellaceae bacterium]|nr:ester cyclase [Gaiellaceae bacterium]
MTRSLRAFVAQERTRASSWACLATGKSIDVQLIDIIRFGDDGLAHEHWGVFDALGMMQQLGAIPGSPPA